MIINSKKETIKNMQECNDDVNVYVLCSKAEGKAIYIDSGGNGEVIVHTRPDTLFSNKFQCD